MNKPVYLGFSILELSKTLHCANSVPIRSYSCLYFPAFGLNAEKIRTIITPNTETFYAVLMYESCHDYVKPKYGEKAKLCYMGRDSFLLYIKSNDMYKDIEEDVETGFDTSNYELDRPLLKGKNKQVIGLMKNELSGKIMTKFVGLRAKTYSYLIDGSEDKKAKGAKKYVIKRKTKLEFIKTV